MTEVGLIAARFTHYATLVLVFGAYAYTNFGANSSSVRLKLERLAIASSLLLLVAAAAVLATTVAGLGGSMASLSDLTLWSAVIEETDFGRVWSARLVMGLALVAISIAVSAHPATVVGHLGILVAGGLVATVALTGHAQVEGGANGWLHRIADAIHLLAAAVWLGVLLPLLFLLRGQGPLRPPDDLGTTVTRLVAFHSIGLAAVIALVLTGIVNSWFLVGNLEQLFATTYGRMLLAKIGLFIIMVGLAAENRLRLVPALARNLVQGADPRATLARLRLHIRGELALGMLILLVVAVLGAIAPAAA